MEQRRLAIYKRSGLPWTTEELNTIIEYCETSTDLINEDEIDSKMAKYKYMYDNVADRPDKDRSDGNCFMELVKITEPGSKKYKESFKACTKVSYESLFGGVTFTKFSIKDYDGKP